MSRLYNGNWLPRLSAGVMAGMGAVRRLSTRRCRPLPLICARPDAGGHRGLSSKKIGSSIQHLPRVADGQETLIFTIDPVLRGDVAVVQVTEIDEPTAGFWNPSGQGDLDPRLFHAGAGIVAAGSLHVRAVRLDHAGDAGEAVCLLQEVVAHVVADLVDQLAMRVGHLGEVRRVDDHLTAVRYGRLCLVHGLGRGPEVVVELRRHRQYTLECPGNVDDLQLCR